MQVKCALTGLEFHCQYIPATVSGKDLCHPIFYLKPAKLISLTTKWAEGSLTTEDSYLLFCALLHSTDLVEWRTTLQRTEQTHQQVALHMEQLAALSTKILHLPNKSAILPSFTVSPASNTLDNISNWLAVWESSIEDYATGYRTTGARNRLLATETLLERYIRNSSLHPAKYSHLLANWAELAGSFPQGDTPVSGGHKLPLGTYWKQLIVRCCLDDGLFTVSTKDLQELLEHCEENIPHGSIYAHSLMKILRDTIEKQRDFFTYSSPASLSLGTSPDTEVGAKNLALLQSLAPASVPRRQDYSSLAGYLKAKIAWDMLQRGTS